MSEHHKSGTPSTGKRTQQPIDIKPVTFEGELPAAPNPRDTVSEGGMAARTRPEIPVAVSIEDMYTKASDVYTQEQKTKAWLDTAEMVQTYSDEMIKRWKEEIDTYLVFVRRLNIRSRKFISFSKATLFQAGLFSAVLTTFNVQSYPLLQPSTPDPTIAVLQQISWQLASFSINPPFVNSTQPSSTRDAKANTSAPVPGWAVWRNTLWFSGLILFLTSASIGIMVKQWLNEYDSGVSGTSRPASRTRQYRLNNLRTWHVEDVISTLPILLQLALALFLAGLLILLWTLHDTVAAVASTLVGLLAVFTLVTTLLPLFDHRCSYLTPQIRALNAIWQPKRFTYSMCSSFLACLSSFDPRLNRYLAELVLRGAIPIIVSVFRSLEHALKTPEAWKERKQTWQGRERSEIDKLARGLDTQTLLEAYRCTLHPDALTAATVCLMDYRSEFVIDYFRQLRSRAFRRCSRLGGRSPRVRESTAAAMVLWLLISLCVLHRDDLPLSDDEAAALRVYFRCGSWLSGMQAADAGWAVSTCNAMFGYLETAGASPGAHFIYKDDIQMEWELLIEATMRRKLSLPDAVYVPLAVTGLYRQALLEQLRLAEAPLDHAKDAHTGYLESVDDFLRWADRALTSPLPVSALEAVCAYTRDVLAELTRTLLGLFAEEKVRTTVESTRLWSIMWGLSRLDDAHVEACIPENFVPDLVRLAEILETTSEYVDNTWVPEIREAACILKANIIRVKHKPDTTYVQTRDELYADDSLSYSPRTSPGIPRVGISGTDAPASLDPAVTSVHSAVDNSSVSARNPKQNSPDACASSCGGTLR
ncbi:hypothetical protein VTO73DRAFT_12741 [Trametes versicolor]